MKCPSRPMCCAPRLELLSPEKGHSTGMGMPGQGHKIKQAHLVQWPHVEVFRVRDSTDDSVQVPPSALCHLQTASTAPDVGGVEPFRDEETARTKCDGAAGRHYCKFALNDAVDLSVYFVSLGVWLLCRGIRFCLNTTCPQENCNELDSVSGNPPVTISHLTVHSIIAAACLPACNYLLIWLSLQVRMGMCKYRKCEGGWRVFLGVIIKEDGRVSLELIVLPVSCKMKSSDEAWAMCWQSDTLQRKWLRWRAGKNNRLFPRGNVKKSTHVSFAGLWQHQSLNEDRHIHPHSNRPLVRLSASVRAHNILIGRGNV